ncbi:hypothetical protein ACWDE9_37740, partial [Streptomyces olivaceoviridis]
MLLAGDGHLVTVVDPDPGAPADSPDGVWEKWDRRGISQWRAAHILAPVGYRVLCQELPDTIGELLHWGSRSHNMIAGALRLLPGGVAEPADQRFDTVAARRPVLEAALSAVAERTEGVSLKRGVGAVGLVTEARSGASGTQVTGVRLEHGGHMAADLVVATSGRRGPAALLPNGGGTRASGEGPGFRYYTRHFRSADGQLPGPAPWPLQHHSSVSVIVVPGDNGTWSTTLVTSGADQDLRILSHDDAWQRVAALYPGLAPWVHGEPVGGVVAMGGIRSVRHQPAGSAQPSLTGFVTAGDAWATTNPQFGLGMSLGIIHATLLRDVLRAEGTSRPVELVQ